MTLEQRVDAFRATFPNWPAAWPRIGREAGRRVLYATWVLGNRYGNRTEYYGSYPNGYLARLLALYPEPRGRTEILHAFAGSLPPGKYIRLDVNRTLRPELVGDVTNLRRLVAGRPFRLMIADPPYTPTDAAQYGVPMVNRRAAMASLARVAAVGCHLAWLDTVWPMHRLEDWRTIGRITIIVSTNHRVRLCSLFERAS